MFIDVISRVFSRDFSEAMRSNPISPVSSRLPSATQPLAISLTSLVRNMLGLSSMFQYLRPSSRLWQDCSRFRGDGVHNAADRLRMRLDYLSDKMTNGRRAVRALSRAGNVDDGLSVDGLVEFLGDRSCAVKIDIERALLKRCSGSPEALRALFLATTRGRTWEIRRRAADLFAQIGTRELALEGVRGHADAKKRYRFQFRRLAAMKVLGRRNATRHIDVFIALSRDKDSIIRQKALSYLGLIARKTTALDNTVIGSDHEFVDGWRMYAKKAVKAIVARMKDPRSFVRKRAAEVVGSYLIRAAMKPLLKLLKDRDPWVRETAAYALAKVGDMSVVPYLKRAHYTATLCGGHRRMLDATNHAMEQIYGRAVLGDDRRYVQRPRPLAG